MRRGTAGTATWCSARLGVRTRVRGAQGRADMKPTLGLWWLLLLVAATASAILRKPKSVGRKVPPESWLTTVRVETSGAH